MGIVWRHDGESERVLTRQAEIPLPTARRPCLLVGGCMAVLFLAASIDAAVWQATADRNAAQVEANALEERVVGLNIELNESEAKRRAAEAEQKRLQAEVVRLNADLRAAEHAFDMLHGELPEHRNCKHGSLKHRLQVVDEQGGSFGYSSEHNAQPRPGTIKLTKECMNNPLHASCR